MTNTLNNSVKDYIVYIDGERLQEDVIDFDMVLAPYEIEKSGFQMSYSPGRYLCDITVYGGGKYYVGAQSIKTEGPVIYLGTKE